MDESKGVGGSRSTTQTPPRTELSGAHMYTHNPTKQSKAGRGEGSQLDPWIQATESKCGIESIETRPPRNPHSSQRLVPIFITCFIITRMHAEAARHPYRISLAIPIPIITDQHQPLPQSLPPYTLAKNGRKISSVSTGRSSMGQCPVCGRGYSVKLSL